VQRSYLLINGFFFLFLTLYEGKEERMDCATSAKPENFVITIARGFGSGGKEIGLRLSDKLGIPCYDRQILKMASDYSGLNEALFVKADEKRKGSMLTKLLKKFTENSPIAEPMQKEFVSDVNLFNIQADIIRRLAKSESCIIIGKCANHILQSYDNVVSVYIEASRKFCVKTVIDRLQVTKEEAHSMIYQTDKYRADYYKYYSGGEVWTDPIAYDMTLNSERVGWDRSVELIAAYIKIKKITKNWEEIL
jgi:cytidylate kinase